MSQLTGSDGLQAFGGVAVTLSNDAMAALQGEVWNGAAKGMQNVVLLTLGSGEQQR